MDTDPGDRKSALKMAIRLIRAAPEDAALLQELQRQAFWPLLEKYRDSDTNPATETIETVREKIQNPDYDTFRIIAAGQTVGAIRIARKNPGRYRIGRIYVIPEWQGQGIAQAAMLACEAMYPDARVWELDTIEQEARNCHLYEKLGYRRTGGREVINERMILIGYEKSVGDT